jgi:hypothetical protein
MELPTVTVPHLERLSPMGATPGDLVVYSPPFKACRATRATHGPNDVTCGDGTNAAWLYTEDGRIPTVAVDAIVHDQWSRDHADHS